MAQRSSLARSSRFQRRANRPRWNELPELPPDPDCEATLELQDALSEEWRAVATQVGLKKVLWAIDEGMEPDEALDWFSDCII